MKQNVTYAGPPLPPSTFLKLITFPLLFLHEQSSILSHFSAGTSLNSDTKIIHTMMKILAAKRNRFCLSITQETKMILQCKTYVSVWIVRDLYIKYLVIVSTVVDFEHEALSNRILLYLWKYFFSSRFLAFLLNVSDQNGHWKHLFEKTLCEIGNY